MDREDVMRFVEDNDVKFIRLQFTDISGIMKNIAINVSHLEEAFDGVLFDGYSIEGFARVEESDMLLIPDLDTLNIIPWRPQQGKVARFICDVSLQNGKPFEGDPRYILKKVLKKGQDQAISSMLNQSVSFFSFIPIMKECQLRKLIILQVILIWPYRSVEKMQGAKCVWHLKIWDFS